MVWHPPSERTRFDTLQRLLAGFHFFISSSFLPYCLFLRFLLHLLPVHPFPFLYLLLYCLSPSTAPTFICSSTVSSFISSVLSLPSFLHLSFISFPSFLHLLSPPVLPLPSFISSVLSFPSSPQVLFLSLSPVLHLFQYCHFISSSTFPSFISSINSPLLHLLQYCPFLHLLLYCPVLHLITTLSVTSLLAHFCFLCIFLCSVFILN